jgi:hypothetical protein
MGFQDRPQGHSQGGRQFASINSGIRVARSASAGHGIEIRALIGPSGGQYIKPLLPVVSPWIKISLTPSATISMYLYSLPS